MFTKVKNWVMEHPVMTGLILIAAVLSFFAFRKMFQGGGGDAIVSPQTIDPSITAAQISAGQQLQSQQIAAGVQQTGIEAQLMAQLDTNAVTEAVTLANLTSSENVALAGIGANQAVSLADIAATENTTIHNIDALVEIATFEPTPEPVALGWKPRRNGLVG